MMKMVNGEVVECSAEEEQEILSEWEANSRMEPVIDKRSAALEAMLQKAAAEPDAPQEVRDYVSTKETVEIAIKR